MKQLISAFNNQPLIAYKNRKYILNPVNDHYPTTSYALMKEMVVELSKLTDFSKATKILGEEDRGGYIASLMAYVHHKPFGLAKWNAPGITGPIWIPFRNAYTHGRMYLHGIEKGDKVILVEDLVDTGGTVVAMIKLLQKMKIKIIDVVAIAEKAEYNGVKRIYKETGCWIKHLLKVDTSAKKSKVIWTYNKGKSFGKKIIKPDMAAPIAATNTAPAAKFLTQ